MIEWRAVTPPRSPAKLDAPPLERRRYCEDSWLCDLVRRSRNEVAAPNPKATYWNPAVGVTSGDETIWTRDRQQRPQRPRLLTLTDGLGPYACLSALSPLTSTPVSDIPVIAHVHARVQNLVNMRSACLHSSCPRSPTRNRAFPFDASTGLKA